MIKRILTLPLSSSETCFLWGPRQSGKSTLLKALFPAARYYDLLLSDQFSRLAADPSLLRQECEALDMNRSSQQDPVIIDEISKLPSLLDEVHWLIENRGLRFILCGSSARKVKRTHGNLLGGRAVRYELHPLVYPEIKEFDLYTALNAGTLPRHYLSAHPQRLLQSYVGDYLKEEITAESLVRNIGAFSRFLEAAALTNGEMVVYKNISTDCGVSEPTVKSYFQILEDTLLGRYLSAFRKRSKRRQILSPKFYFFDVGVISYLTHRGSVKAGSELFGKAFEHLLFNELTAYSGYSEKFFPISYWKTASGVEVDFILGQGEVAVEVKSASMVRSRHLRGLRAFMEEFSPHRAVVVSLDPEPRKTEDGIEILPWRNFLDALWADEII